MRPQMAGRCDDHRSWQATKITRAPESGPAGPPGKNDVGVDWLSDLDSNQDKILQRDLCYHYTIGQTAEKITVNPPEVKENFPLRAKSPCQCASNDRAEAGFSGSFNKALAICVKKSASAHDALLPHSDSTASPKRALDFFQIPDPPNASTFIQPESPKFSRKSRASFSASAERSTSAKVVEPLPDINATVAPWARRNSW
jgi:hypothetical protein